MKAQPKEAETMPELAQIDTSQAQADHPLPPVQRRRRRRSRPSVEVITTSRGTQRVRPLPPPNRAMRDALIEAACREG